MENAPVFVNTPDIRDIAPYRATAQLVYNGRIIPLRRAITRFGTALNCNFRILDNNPVQMEVQLISKLAEPPQFTPISRKRCMAKLRVNKDTVAKVSIGGRPIGKEVWVPLEDGNQIIVETRTKRHELMFEVIEQQPSAVPFLTPATATPARPPMISKDPLFVVKLKDSIEKQQSETPATIPDNRVKKLLPPPPPPPPPSVPEPAPKPVPTADPASVPVLNVPGIEKGSGFYYQEIEKPGVLYLIRRVGPKEWGRFLKVIASPVSHRDQGIQTDWNEPCVSEKKSLTRANSRTCSIKNSIIKTDGHVSPEITGIQESETTVVQESETIIGEDDQDETASEKTLSNSILTPSSVNRSHSEISSSLELRIENFNVEKPESESILSDLNSFLDHENKISNENHTTSSSSLSSIKTNESSIESNHLYNDNEDCIDVFEILKTVSDSQNHYILETESFDSLIMINRTNDHRIRKEPGDPVVADLTRLFYLRQRKETVDHPEWLGQCRQWLTEIRDTSVEILDLRPLFRSTMEFEFNLVENLEWLFFEEETTVKKESQDTSIPIEPVIETKPIIVESINPPNQDEIISISLPIQTDGDAQDRIQTSAAEIPDQKSKKKSPVVENPSPPPPKKLKPKKILDIKNDDEKKPKKPKRKKSREKKKKDSPIASSPVPDVVPNQQQPNSATTAQVESWAGRLRPRKPKPAPPPPVTKQRRKNR